MDESVDLVEKGFQLAHFIVADRHAALNILSGALNKLEARRTREKKRAYWRDKHLKRWITSITRSDADILQWLILFESDAYERENDACGNPSARDMAMRYIKHLVQATTALSSFHVNVGLSRLLYNYSGAETQRMYELIAERYVGTDQYRRAKNLLREKLEQRLGRFLKSWKTPQGELRFEPAEDQGRWVQLVRECLTAFTPWSTAEACSVLSSPNSRSGPFPHSLSGRPHGKEEFDRIESSRCHVFIEPLCFSRLTTCLGLRSPEQALALPRFFVDEDVDREDRPQDPPPTASLTLEERKGLEESLAKQAARRRRATPEIVKIVVDGVERISMNSAAERERKFEVLQGARLIEVWAEEEGAPLLLATHFLSYDESANFAPFALTVNARNHARFVLSLVLDSVGEEGSRRGSVTLHYFPKSEFFIWRNVVRFLLERFRTIPSYVWAAIVLLSLGWAASIAVYRRDMSAERKALESAQEELAAEKASHPLPSAISSYRLIPDELNVRGQAGFDAPVVFVPTQPGLVSLQLPVAERTMRLYHASLELLSDQKEILREGFLTPSATGSGPVIVFIFPSSILKEDEDYTVYLEHVNSKGRPEIIRSFTFHTLKR